MAAILSTFWTEIRAAIGSVWTDVLPVNLGRGIHRAISIQKLDWQTVGIDGNGVGRPYCVVLYSTRQADTLALAAQQYEMDAEIFYIAPDATGIAATIDTKLEALGDALYEYEFANGVQFVDVISHDSTEANAANQVFLALNVPFSAGSVRARFYLGATL